MQQSYKMAQSGSNTAHDQCPFCQISKSIPMPGTTSDQTASSGQDPKPEPPEHFFADDQLFVIKDIKPRTTHHYLVITRQHIDSAKALTKKDVDLVKRMVEVGAQVLKNRITEGEVDLKNIHLGFHWPPLVLIKHLHMHVMYPASDMSFLAKNIIFRPGLLFVTPDSLIDRIQSIPDQ